MSERGRRLALIGFMGSGKTTVGRLVAEMLGLNLVDLDEVIAAQAGQSIPEIFAREGEAGFRRREREALLGISGRKGLVLATGGGIVVDPENVADLRRHGSVVFLRASLAEITARVGGGSSRPLWAGRPPEELAELWSAREKLYLGAADYAVETDGRDPAEVAGEIARWYRSTRMREEAVEVPLPGREYRIHIGPGLLTRTGQFCAALGRPGRVLIVTNPTVARWYLPPLRNSLAAAGCQVHEAVIPDGEEYKSLAQAGELYAAAAGASLDRTDAVVALGGGVIGDLAGFVAATYLRGINFVQVPTTLLAQIDSSIGGKTAVNLPAGKNLVGAFHQPRLVVSDTGTLATLAEREIRAGLIEVLKHGLLDAEYFSWYEENLSRLFDRDEETLTQGIAWSCRIKAAVVVTDERESGPRALLNLGHTVGHALEKVAGYGRWRHGEAVGFGLLAAGKIALRLEMLTGEEQRRLAGVVRATLGPQMPRIDAAQIEPLVAALYLDKKTVAGRLRFVLPRGIGRAEVVDLAEDQVRRALSDLTAEEV